MEVGSHEHNPSESERPDWSASQTSPNGQYYATPYPHPQQEYERAGLIVPRSDGLPIDSSEHEHEYPATPINATSQPYGHSNEDDPGSGNKKTRTKPIRNAEGILIRKDGRPDMRSVSSANNLRKVHAKKEAERAEAEGRTPTSARSLAPAHSSSLSDRVDTDDEAEGEEHVVSRDGTPGTQADGDSAAHDDAGNVAPHGVMSKVFPDNPSNTASQYFPRADEAEPTALEAKGESQERSNEQSRQQSEIVTGDKSSSEEQAYTRPLLETDGRPHLADEHVGLMQHKQTASEEEQHQQKGEQAELPMREQTA